MGGGAQGPLAGRVWEPLPGAPMFKGLATVAKGLIKETVKEAGRQVRQSVERQRDLQPERSEEVPVCDAHSGRPRRKIADLAVTVKQCRGLPASSWESAGTVGSTDSYCVVKVEGARRSTAVVRKELNPAWNAKMRFNITDISADLVIQVFSVGGSVGAQTKLIGQAIVPLHRLLPKIGNDTSIGEQTQWIELFPLPKDMPRFQTIPHKLKSDLVGMRRPRSALGRIQVTFHLQLLQPLTDTYWTALPPLPATFGGISRAIPRPAGSDDLLPDFKLIKWNVDRIESVLNRPPSWWVLVKAVRAWHSPVLSIVVIIFMLGVVLTARLWQLPMLFASVVCALSFLSRKLRPTLRDREVVTFYEEDPEAPTVIEKALEAKKQLLDVQVSHPPSTLYPSITALSFSHDAHAYIHFLSTLPQSIVFQSSLSITQMHTGAAAETLERLGTAFNPKP